MKKLFIIILLLISYSAKAQEFTIANNDTTILTEYNDGKLWAYKQIGNFVVGMTNHVEKNNYGKYYQILIFIKNLSNTSVLFDPSLVTATLTNKYGETNEMKVYSYERYMRKIKNQQAWSMAIMGFSSGINAGMDSYQNTYTTTYGVGHVPYTQVHTTYNYGSASATNMAINSQIMSLSSMMSYDKKTISQGYIKLTTIHPDEGIIGYVNIKHRKGVRMTINIPIVDQVFSFEWDVTKKTK